MSTLPPAGSHALAWRQMGVARGCVLALAGVSLLLLIIVFAQYLHLSWIAIRYPFELDYGEGIVWQQADMMLTPLMYGDITQYPFVVFHYPPLYHLAVRALAGLGVPMLMAGRGLSFTAGLVIALCLSALTHHAVAERMNRPVRLFATVVTGLVVFTMWPFAVWSTTMRVDMLALAFSFAGVLSAVKSVTWPRLLFVSITAFVLAVYTKQTAIIAPLATMGVMFFATPRRAVKATAFGLVLALVALGAMTLATGGGFLRHIVLYNVNRFTFAALLRAGRAVPWHIIYLGLACLGIALGWRRMRAETAPLLTFRQRLIADPFACVLTIVSLYLIGTTCSLGALAKSGGSFNYLIEWMCVWSIPIGMAAGWAVSWALKAPSGGQSCVLGGFATLGLLAVQVMIIPSVWNPVLSDTAGQRNLTLLEDAIRAAPKPVLSDDMVLLRKAGKEVPWEPSIFAELASQGRWDERLIVELIEARRFAFVVTSGGVGNADYDSRFNPAVTKAIVTAYPKVDIIAGHLVHRPLP